MGSRFGSPKQLYPFGPNGETMLDFSILDAERAGFSRVVLVVRPEMRAAFETGVAARWRGRLPLELADQLTASAARRKPWGTGHAVLAAAGAVRGPFAVVNADDFYGASAYRQLARFLASARDEEATYALVGFPLSETLAESGGVNRALLRTTADGWLDDIEEITGIEASGDDGHYQAASGEVRTIPGDALVSMNVWAFTRAFFPQLEEGFTEFRSAHAADHGAEFLLPTHVRGLIRSRRARVRVLSGVGPWCGVTNPQDAERVRRFLAGLVARGEYPSPVWS
jgi:hypothetical protein